MRLGDRRWETEDEGQNDDIRMMSDRGWEPNDEK